MDTCVHAETVSFSAPWAALAMVEPGIIPLNRCVGFASFRDAFETPRRHAHLHARFDSGLFLKVRAFATVTAEVAAPP